MAKHELVCIRAFTIPEQKLGPMRITGLGGVDLGTVGDPITIPAKHYVVGSRASFGNKRDADKWIKSGNWEYAR